jgi:hypothetical protein
LYILIFSFFWCETWWQKIFEWMIAGIP